MNIIFLGGLSLALFLAQLLLFKKWRSSMTMPSNMHWVRVATCLATWVPLFAILVINFNDRSYRSPHLWIWYICFIPVASVSIALLNSQWRFAKPLTLRGGSFYLLKGVPSFTVLAICMIGFNYASDNNWVLVIGVMLMYSGLAAVGQLLRVWYHRSMVIRKLLGYSTVFIPVQFDRADVIYCSAHTIDRFKIELMDERNGQDTFYIAFDRLGKPFPHWHYLTSDDDVVDQFAPALTVGVPASQREKYLLFGRKNARGGCEFCKNKY